MLYDEIMKRSLLAFFAITTTILGAGCGMQQFEPSVGQLLDAPISLNIAGSAVKVNVKSRLIQKTVRLGVVVTGKTQTVSQLQLTNVYLVTTEGVWSSDVSRLMQRKCRKNCLSAIAKGPANGLKLGQGVQIVVALKTPKGSTVFVKDKKGQLLGQ